MSVRQDASDQKAEPIAPISKLPFDVLSEIFVLCSVPNRLSPVAIASVCRRWRETILMTPKAWSRIFPQNSTQFILPPKYVSIFLERSKPYLLHIRIPWASRDCYCAGHHWENTTTCDCANVATILRCGDRIQCLSVTQDWIKELNKGEYLNLRRLEFSKYEHDDPALDYCLDMSRFKNLQTLTLSHPLQVNPIMDFSSGPRLKSLRLPTDPNDLWVSTVAIFSNSLEVLWLDGNFGESKTRRWTLQCPRLLTVLIVEGNTRGKKGTRVLEIVCPQLVAYEYYSSKDEIVEVALLGGVERITILRINETMPLSPYKQLEILQLDVGYDWLDSVLRQLERDYHLCPALKYIEVGDKPDSYYELASHERIANRNRVAGSDIKLAFVASWLHCMPAYFPTCDDGMPCRITYQHRT